MSHGYQTDTKKISSISAYFETMPYRVNEKTGNIDYDQLATTAEQPVQDVGGDDVQVVTDDREVTGDDEIRRALPRCKG